MKQQVSWLHILLSVAMSVAALYGWRSSLVNLPSNLQHVRGVISSSEVTRGGRARNINFSIASRDFTYPGILPNMTLAVELLKPGNIATVGYTSGDSPELWELTINGQVVVQPLAAHQARLMNGEWAFWLFVAFALSSVYLAWRVHKQHR